MTTNTQDSGQSPRIGQRLPAEGGSKIELVEDVLSLPEAPWPGRMVYNTDLSAFQIYSGNVGGWITANDASGNITFVQDTEPTATSVGDWWVKTNGPGVEDNQLYVWDGSDWLLYVDPTAAGKNKTFYQDSTPTAEAEGDIWFDSNDNNKQWRWDGAVWTSVRDGNIAVAQSTADGKNTVFYQTSAPSANKAGDIWFDTDDGNKCYVSTASGSGSWVLRQDSATAQSTADSKIKTFTQTTTPTATTVGDLWYDTDDNNQMWRWNGSTWISVRDGTIATAQSTADGKNTVFYATSAPSANKAGDLWFDTDDGNHPYVSTGSGTGNWTSRRDATIAVAQAAADAAAADAATAIADAATAQATADGKVETYFQNTQPTTPPASVGDVWYNTDTGQVATLTSIGASDDLDVWDPVQDLRLIASLQAAQDAQATADGKITTFFATADEVAAEEPSLGDLWYNTDEDNKRYRWGYDSDNNTLAWLPLSTPTVPEKIVPGTVNSALTFASTNTLQNAIPDPGSSVATIVQGHATGQSFPVTPDGYSARGIAWDSDNSRWIQLLERTDPTSPNTGQPFIRTISTGGSPGSPTLCDTNGIDSKGVRWGITYYNNGGSGTARYIYCVGDTGPQTQSIFRIRVDGANFGNYNADRALPVGDAVILIGDTSGQQYTINEDAFTSTGNKRINRFSNTLGTIDYAYLSVPSSTYYANYLRCGGVGDYGYGSSKITLIGSSSGDYHLVFDPPNFTSHTASSINTTYTYAHNTSCSGGAFFKTSTGEIFSRDGASTTLAKWGTFFPTNKYWSVTYSNGLSGSMNTAHTMAANYASVAITPRNYMSVSLPAAPTGITAARVWVRYDSTKQSGAPSGSTHYNAGDITTRTLSLGQAEGSPANQGPGTGTTSVFNNNTGLGSQLGTIQSSAGGLLLKGDGTLEATTPAFMAWPTYNDVVLGSNTAVTSTGDATIISDTFTVRKSTSRFLVLLTGQATIGNTDDTITLTLRVNSVDQSRLVIVRGRANDRLPLHGAWVLRADNLSLAVGSYDIRIRAHIGSSGESVTLDTHTRMQILGF